MNSGCSFNTVERTVDVHSTRLSNRLYNRLSNRLYNRFDNRLYCVNGVSTKLMAANHHWGDWVDYGVLWRIIHSHCGMRRILRCGSSLQLVIFDVFAPYLCHGTFKKKFPLGSTWECLLTDVGESGSKNRVACEKHNGIRLSTVRKYGVVELQRAVNALAVLSHVTGFCAGWIRSSGIRFILQDYLRAGGPRPFNAEPSSRLVLNVRINYWAAVCIHAFVTWVHYVGSMFWRIFGSPRWPWNE